MPRIIPHELRKPALRFILVKTGQKVPIEKAWPTTANYDSEDERLLKHIEAGGNYGVLCGPGDLVILDIDDRETAQDLERTLRTFTVRSGGGGTHFYLFCPALTKKIVLQKDGKHIGEILSYGSFAVAPGSVHPNGRSYEVIAHNDIETISISELAIALAPFTPKLPHAERPNKQNNSTLQPATISNAPKHDALIEAFKKRYYIEEDYTITLPLCAIIANYIPGDPDIIGIIGPSGSLKTEILRIFGETENDLVYPVSAVTEHTFVSGHRENIDTLALLNKRAIVIKDFTTILSMREDTRAQIFSDLREITDGYIRKEFGNGVKKEYRDLHSSIIFASTSVIERFHSLYHHLGARIVFFRPRSDPALARAASWRARTERNKYRQELHDLTLAFLRHTIPLATSTLPTLSQDAEKYIETITELVAICRTPVHRNHKGDIDEIPEPEFPTRLFNTIARLTLVHALIHDRREVAEPDLDFATRIATDNIPTARARLLLALSPKYQTTTEIAEAARLETTQTRYILAELVTLRVAHRLPKENKNDDDDDARTDSYRLLDHWTPAMEKIRRTLPKLPEPDAENPTAVLERERIKAEKIEKFDELDNRWRD